MTLEAKLHALWPTIGSGALEALLPVARVFTGTAPPNTTMPYCSLQRPAATLAERTDKATAKDVQIRFHVWDDDFDRGQSIQDAIESGFENRSFDLTIGRVTDFLPDAKYHLDEKAAGRPAVYQFVSTFTARVRRARTQ